MEDHSEESPGMDWEGEKMLLTLLAIHMVSGLMAEGLLRANADNEESEEANGTDE